MIHAKALKSQHRNPATQDPVFCIYPFTKVRLTCEGDVFFCCFHRIQPIGNLLTQEFADIWAGEKAEAVRAAILKGQLHSMCDLESCPHQYLQRRPAVDSELGFPIPQLLEVDLPNTDCNFGGASPSVTNPACLMCERSLPGFQFQRTNHLAELLPRLTPLLPRLRNIHIQGTAEPFWRDAIFKTLDQIGFAGFEKQIQVSTVTNGSLFDSKLQDRFLNTIEKSTVSFSLDASSAETYQKIRRHDLFDRVVKNLATYKQKRKAHPHAFLRIYNNINLLNIHEVIPMVELAAEMSVDILEFNPTWGQPTEILVNPSNAPVFARAQESILSRANQLGVHVQFLRPLDLNLTKETKESNAAAVSPEGAL